MKSNPFEELDVLRDQAMGVMFNREKPISHAREDIAEIIQLAFELGKKKTLEMIEKDRRAQAEEELRKPPYL